MDRVFGNFSPVTSSPRFTSLQMDIVSSNLQGNSRENCVYHPKFWFEDGSAILRVQDHLFKIHRSFLSRHSSFFAQHQSIAKSSKDNREDGDVDCNYIVVGHERRVLVHDVEVLLEHLYHDVYVSDRSTYHRTYALIQSFEAHYFPKLQ